MNHSKRNINIDIIKVLAFFLVIGVHFFLYTGYNSTSFVYSYFSLPFIAIRNICMTCVPLFIIVTGYLNKDKTWNKTYYLNIFRIYLIYSITILLLTFIDLEYKINFNLFKTFLVNMLNFRFYGWYINMYIGLMLVAPIFNIAFKTMSEQIRKYAVFNIILAISIPVTLVDLFVNIKYSILANSLPNWWYYSWPLIYYMIGLLFAYDKTFVIDFFKRTKLIFLMTLITSSFLYFILNIHTETTLYANIFIVILSILIFSYFINMNTSTSILYTLKPYIIYISNNTLLAFLLSYIVDTYVYPKILYRIVSVNIRLTLLPLIVIVNFLLTILITAIISSILKRIKLL